jgi:hypothetical protein
MGKYILGIIIITNIPFGRSLYLHFRQFNRILMAKKSRGKAPAPKRLNTQLTMISQMIEIHPRIGSKITGRTPVDYDIYHYTG